MVTAANADDMKHGAGIGSMSGGISGRLLFASVSGSAAMARNDGRGHGASPQCRRTFERLDGGGGVRVRSDQLEKPHKKTDGGNAQRNRAVTLQDSR
jgi:hypothetical protein